jgi:hypothetical protein
MTLIKLRELAVDPVSKFITDKTIGSSARSILSHIGAPAFRIIWSAYSNVNDVEGREVARIIFHNMPTREIRGDLVGLLTSNKPLDFEMAMTLLVERIYEDESLSIDKQEMVSSLLEHICMNQHDESNQRILAFLLVLPKRLVIDHFVRALYRYPDRSAWMIPAFLLIGMEGKEARKTLDEMLQGRLPSALLSHVMSVLGMMEAHPNVVRRASSVGHGMQLEERMVALHALGGLLAGGRWNHTILETLLNNSKEGSSEHELYSLLLGMPYATRLAQVQKELSDEKQAHEADNQRYRENTARLEHNLQEKEHERARLTKTLDETRYEANKAATFETQNRLLTESNSQLNENVRRLVYENEELKLKVRRLESSNDFHFPHL